MKKVLLVIVVLTMVLGIFSGCTAKPAPDATAKPAPDATGNVDVVTTASLVNEEAAFLNAISKDGTWIICTLGDLTTDKDLVLEGEFYDKADTTKDLYRKLALYAQDADKNVTARYILTAPKLTIKSPNAKIQGGTFKGDVYVEANGFNLQDATVDGNIYYSSQEFKDSSVIGTEEGSVGTVTGTVEVQ